MALGTAVSVPPRDLGGNPLTIDDIKSMIMRDVSDLSDAYAEKDADDAERAARGVFSPSRILERRVKMLEAAHDLHWDWYRVVVNAAP